jgi:hypothetical protein
MQEVLATCNWAFRQSKPALKAFVTTLGYNNDKRTCNCNISVRLEVVQQLLTCSLISDSPKQRPAPVKPSQKSLCSQGTP